MNSNWHAGSSTRETVVPLKVLLFSQGSRLCLAFPAMLSGSSETTHLEDLLLLAGSWPS